MLITMNAEKTGIYRIISPTGRVYIGQSVDINKRWKTYMQPCPNQPVLNKSLQKYGYDQHIFSVVEECPKELLDERELYWFNEYVNGNYSMLNCVIPGTLNKFSSTGEKETPTTEKQYLYSMVRFRVQQKLNKLYHTDSKSYIRLAKLISEYGE